MKGRHQIYDIEIYKKKLIVVDTPKPKYVQKLLTNVEFEDEEVFGHAIWDEYKGKNGLFIIVDSSHKQFKPSVLVHECVHISNMIFQIVGYEPDRNNDEAQAYLVEYIFEKAWEFIYGES